MQLPRSDVPNPIKPQTWHFRQSIEYSLATNYAILDLASERKEDFLFNMYRMAKNAIEKGSRDSWTIHPSRIAAVKAEIAKQNPAGGGRGRANTALYSSVLQDPAQRDPRGYILPSDQPDFLTATKFVNILIKGGVTVHRAAAPFTVNAKSYPAGSFIVKSAQPFRAHVMDMFEPQDHPDDIPYPGAAPRPPYDVTGYNLSYSMGIKYDRILDGFDGPFVALTNVVTPSAGRLTEAPIGGGYLISHQVNDAFVAVNRLLKAKEAVHWTNASLTANGKTYPPGTMFVPSSPSAFGVLQKVAADKGIAVETVASPPAGGMKLRPVRVGLWDTYGGSMPSGWTRWLLEQFEFPFEVVFPKTLDAGNLIDKYDVLIFVDGAIPARDTGGGNQPQAASIPAEFRDWLGTVTVARTVPQLRAFVEAGGTLLTIGSSTAIGNHLGLPIRDALTETVNGAEVRLPNSKYYVPGSLLEARVDNTHPLAYGLDDRVHVFFDQSEAFRLLPEAAAKGVKSVAWIDNAAPLKSGWAWGQQYLDQAVEIIEARVGKGRVVLFGPEIAWRAQPHGTFKFLFNGIYYGGAAAE
jgi:hypothetical protein